MKQIVYVLSETGEPLMPTRRIGKVKRLLNKGKARIKSHHPFTIQLKYKTENKLQPLYGGIDPGRTNIGLAVIDQKGHVLYRGHITTRNKDVPKLMSERRQHRMTSRRGERLRRKRRAKSHHTLMASGSVDRKLLGYADGTVTVKGILNTEARFNNRLRPEGWITPTVRQLIQTHISAVKLVEKILPVTNWTLETNKFAFMAIDNGSYYGVDFTSGRMKGYLSVESYVSARQEGKCIVCGKPIEQYHHVVPKHKRGSNLPENIVGLCKECHEKVHTGKLSLEAEGVKKKYAALSVLNQSIPYIYKELVHLFGIGHVHGTEGYKTYKARTIQGFSKDHDIDAAVIAGNGMNISIQPDDVECLEIRQFRRHDRQRIKMQRERTYKLDGKVICKNRKPRFEQPEKIPAFSQWYRQMVLTCGKKEAANMAAKVTVTPSKRYYNVMDRIMPGTVFEFGKKRYIVSGQLSGGQYYRALGMAKCNFPAKQCRIIRQNEGLVYVV